MFAFKEVFFIKVFHLLELLTIEEDDFFILDKNAFNDFVSDFSSIKNNDDWSVITFTRRAGTYYGKYDDNFNYIKETQTMSGYIIKTTFIETLMEQLEIGITNMENGLSEHNNTCDQIWKPLQKDNKVAIHALCKEPVFWETMEKLKSNGASSILVLPVEKILN